LNPVVKGDYLRIGVLADTHLSGELVPDYVIEALGRVDLILHAGDILDMPVIEQLSGIADTFAVRGNMDHPDVKGVLPARRFIEVGDFKIGLTHGRGGPSGMVERVASEFRDVDCIIFGHTHNALAEERNGVLFFNPGSPTDRRFTDRNSIGILEVTDRIVPWIIEIERPPGRGGD
jgi:putative phosphoesterase